MFSSIGYMLHQFSSVQFSSVQLQQQQQQQQQQQFNCISSGAAAVPLQLVAVSY